MTRPAPPPDSTPMEIERWEGFGGTWRVESVDDRRCRIALCRCDGGEIVDHFESEEPAIVRWAMQQVPRGGTDS